jgi:hypothetical protein
MEPVFLLYSRAPKNDDLLRSSASISVNFTKRKLATMVIKLATGCEFVFYIMMPP